MNRQPQASLRSRAENRSPLYVAVCLFGLLCSFLLATPAVSGPPAYLGEHLNYTISYRGVFSAMNWVDIADAELQTERSAFNGQPVYRSHLQVSTEAYGKMEQFYPLRYRFESYFSTDLQRTLLFDEQKKTHKERREIVWVDWEQREANRYKQKASKATKEGNREEWEQFDFGAYGQLKEKKANGLPPILTELDTTDQGQFRQARGANLRRLSNILDQLSLLQAVRIQELTAGQEIQLPVMDGDDVLSYRIQVVKRETIEQQGQSWDTFQLRFEAFKQGAEEGEVEHPPIYVWLTTDDRRIPVRFASNYALGKFAGQLKTLDSIAGLPKSEHLAALH